MPSRLILLLCGLTLSACSGGDGSDSSSPTTGAPSGTGSVAAIWVQDPLLTTPNALAPLAANLTLETTEPVRVSVAMSSGDKQRVWDFAALDTVHSIPLVGFNPGRVWQVDVSVETEDGTVVPAAPLEFDAPAVLDVYPDFNVLAHDTSAVQPGWTLLMLRTIGGGAGVPKENLVMLDEDMELVWYFQSPERLQHVIQRQNGMLMLMQGGMDTTGSFFLERDLYGLPQMRYDSKTSDEDLTDDDDLTDLETRIGGATGTFQGFHHEIMEMPTPGTFVTLSKKAPPFQEPNFPLSYTDPAITVDSEISVDLLVEFAEDGSILNTIDMSDWLDTTRIGYESLDLSNFDKHLDWTHGNAVHYDPSTDTWLVSVRNQDAVAAFDRASGSLKWILGNHDNWSPDLQPYLLTAVGPLTWQFHQHAAKLDGDRVLMFDNGNWGASPFTDATELDEFPEDLRTRVVEFKIDEVAMTVEQSWELLELTNGEHPQAPAVGNSAWLDNGNVFATWGIASAISGQSIASMGLGSQAIRLAEFTPDPSGNHTIHSDVFITIDGSLLSEGWQTYRAERIASPYPPDTLR